MLPSRHEAIAKIAGILFFLFLLLLIAAVDAGRMPPLVRTLHNFPQGDRVGHVVLFGILSFLFTAAFPGVWRLRDLRLPIASLAVLLFAIAEESSQSFFSTRTADFIDMVCSCIGVGAGSWAACRWRARPPAPQAAKVSA